MPIKRIPPERLELGMYVTAQTHGLESNNFRQQGFVRKQSTLQKLRELSLDEIYIDTEKGKDSVFSLPLIAPVETIVPIKTLEEELPAAKAIYNEALSVVDNLMRDVKLAGKVEVEPIEKVADDIVGSVFNNQNALLCMSQIRQKDRYLLEHSINVGMLLGIFSRSLGYPDEVVHQLVTGGILHDIGKTLVPDEVLHKPGSLNQDEWQVMKKHVDFGRDILQNSEGVSDIALAVCSEHHEKMDGSGYPDSKAADTLSNYGRMAAICLERTFGP